MEDEKKETPGQEEANPLSVLDKAELIAKRIEEGNKKFEELVQRQESAAAKNILGGRAEAGIAPKPETPLTPQEYSNKLLSGEISPLS